VKDTCGVERTIDGSIVVLPLHMDDVKPGLYHFTIKAKGVMDGRVVEHTAAAHYERYAAGYRYGPMEEQRLDLTVMQPPKVLLTVPEQISVERGKRIPIKVTAARFLDARKSELIIKAESLPPGISAESVRLGPEAKQVEMNVTVSAEAKPGQIPVVLRAEDAQNPRKLAQSSIILLKISDKTERP
jgi:hypothetical protein